VRLFVALELPPAARDALAAWATELELPFVRRVGEEALHLTLCFLGERPDADPVRAAVGGVLAAAAPAGPLRVTATRWLPRGRPRVLAVELDDPGGALATVSAELHAALEVAREHRRFLPHITVGRVRGAVRRPPATSPPDISPITAGPVSLIRSHLDGGPVRYERIAEWTLGAG
jgi:2'-5' RNA ligase